MKHVLSLKRLITSQPYQAAYRVRGCPLAIVKNADGRWSISPLVVSGRDDVQDWHERNPELEATSFPTLREAREYLRAVLDLDPHPAQSHDHEPDPRARLTRVRAGHYRMVLRDAGEVLFQGELRRDEDKRSWILWAAYQGHHQVIINHYPTLATARSVQSARRLMRRRWT